MIRNRTRRLRPFSCRCLCLVLVLLGFALYCYYYKLTPENEIKPKKPPSGGKVNVKGRPRFYQAPVMVAVTKAVTNKIEAQVPPDQCPAIEESVTDIDTVAVFPSFEFQPSWMPSKEFWDKTFEDRYEKICHDTNRPTLKVIVVPHSHNDPGWLVTFEQYFETKTKNIINNVVSKLQEFPNMTFIWTEISFLHTWWERSHPNKRKALQDLIKEGRLEITTGGWVMPDEACTHIYALIDQFVEGHDWVKNNLNVIPVTGWSIDPFGHGPTVPYLLDQSGLKATIIQRIHYAWKQWLARKQIEEFYWMSGWGNKKPNMVVHNQPFDIYSIKSTCGPHPSICLSFDFRAVPGEYSEYTAKHEEITDQNLHSKSKTLIEEYHRIGTLTPHNVVLVPLGDDFRYEFAAEFDAQYNNYVKMFNYINSHKELFNADVQFGTPKDYFDAVDKRHKNIPTLKGDFFVYADIFSEGKPAYWSGYFTTRPYIKILARQLEHHLRTAEILFTLVSNLMKQNSDPKYDTMTVRLNAHYEHLVSARRNLGLFQHHDAITGTSKANVMYDYGSRMYQSLQRCARLQETALTAVVLPPNVNTSVLQSEAEWDNYGTLPNKLHVSFSDRNKIVLFNPLTENRTEVINLRTVHSDVRIFDEEDEVHVLYQISPIIQYKERQRHILSNAFELYFVATVPALSSRTYTLQEHVNASHNSIVFCKECDQLKSEVFVTKQMIPGDIQLENSVMRLLVNRNTGFLTQIHRNDIGKKNVVDIYFGAYQSAQRHSGAYLFMPDYDSPERNVLGTYTDPSVPQDCNIIIVSGPVYAEITTFYLPFLVHTARIFNVEHPVLKRAVLLQTVVDFESPPKNRDTELFMRIQTDIQNGDVPEFYTDQNGFQYQKRVKVGKLGIEANYYPITTMAWLQDQKTRLTLITNHAQGAAAFEPGHLEVMLDRRSLYDDFRGIGEGVVDNKKTLFENWLLLESMPSVTRDKRDTTEKQFQFVNERLSNPNKKKNKYQVPSQAAEYLSRTLNYPVNVYLLVKSEMRDMKAKPSVQLVQNFPTGIHLMTLRTITQFAGVQVPSRDAYMVVQRPGYSCEMGHPSTVKPVTFTDNTKFTGLIIKNITSVSLTGLKEYANLTSLCDVHLEPMEVRTYKIHF